MQDQFFDQPGGTQVLPRSGNEAGWKSAPFDGRIVDRPSDTSSRQDVKDPPTSQTNNISNRSEFEPNRHAGKPRFVAWPWLTGAASIALAALIWIGFALGRPGCTDAARASDREQAARS